ncbi:MAG: L,D-transpeptidase [Chloroflexota bacterium]
MSEETNQVRQAIQNAREALRTGDAFAAKRWAELAAELAPETEDPWLLLTAVSEPRAALEHAKRALVINPQSQRARKAVEWAQSRVGTESPPLPAAPVADEPIAALRRNVAAPAPGAQGIPLSAPRRKETPKPVPPAPQPKRRSLAYPILLAGFICVAVAVAGYSAVNVPAVASILSAGNAPVFTATSEGPRFLQAALDKPTFTPEWTATPEFTFTPSLTPTSTATFTPSLTLTPTETLTPEFTFTPTITDTPPPTETPGVAEAVVLVDTPTSVAPPTRVAPTQVAAQPGGGNGARWIDVNLSQQRVYAYEGDVAVNSFLASTGTWATPTVTGSYKIYVKYVSTTMSGPGYYLPNVPYTMYFYKGYGIHGTYWHNNFGVPMSHGCVNLSIPDAEWLYYWASVGTVVNVHY